MTVKVKLASGEVVEAIATAMRTDWATLVAKISGNFVALGQWRPEHVQAAAEEGRTLVA